MCQVLALRSSVGLLREWGAGTVRARWQGAGRPGSGVVRAEGPGMKAAGDQMWKESPGNDRGQRGRPLLLQLLGTSEAGLDRQWPATLPVTPPGPSCLVTQSLVIWGSGATSQPPDAIATLLSPPPLPHSSPFPHHPSPLLGVGKGSAHLNCSRPGLLAGEATVCPGGGRLLLPPFPPAFSSLA